MKTLLAITFPILPGKTAQFRQFTEELNTTYAAQFAESRKRLGVHERTFLQSTPHGDMVIVTLEGENPAKAFADFGQQNDSFTQWFSKQVMEINGIDLKSPPTGPMPELIVDSTQAVYQS